MRNMFLPCSIDNPVRETALLVINSLLDSQFISYEGFDKRNDTKILFCVLYDNGLEKLHPSVEF